MKIFKKYAKLEKAFNTITQFALPTLTIIGFTLTASKNPRIGLLFNLVAQVFWVYSSYKAWKKAGQLGMFITSIIITVVVLYGLINYWFL